MSTHDALRDARDVLKSRGFPRDLASAAHIQAILDQRGCEDLDPAAETLPDLIDIILYG